jgi:hypothetical protein
MRLAPPLATRILIACALAAVGGPVAADTIHLADGRVLEGSVQWHPDGSAVDIHITSTGIDAIITVPATKVVRIDPGLGPHEKALAEVESRRAALGAAAAPEEYLALAREARAIGDDTLARQVIHDLLAIDPANAQAHLFLGEMLVNGVWMTVPEAMAAQGFVLYDDRWMPQAEAARLQQEDAQRRADEDAARHAREAQERALEQGAATPATPGYIGYDGSDDGMDAGSGSYDMGGWPWWFGGPVLIAPHHHHHHFRSGFGGGFGGGFGFGRGGFGHVSAGGFGAVAGGRR